MAVTRTLLTPISWIWAAATARRIARGRPVDPGAPVICVGNLTLGGTGKTPIVRELAGRLSAAGWAPHILSRGHGGRLTGPTRVDPARHTALDVGDEALMMAGDAPVWVARDRLAGAEAAVRAGADIIVMDDGHQNPSVAKTLSLIVVDGETRDGEWPFGDGAVFPAGPMREPLKAGLARADAVVMLLPDDLAGAEPGTAGSVRRHAGADRPPLARLAPAARPPDRLRRHRQAVEDGASAEGRRLRSGRLRGPARSRPAHGPNPEFSRGAGRGAGRRSGHQREGLGAA